jgi:hypothetical protein
MPNSSTRGSPDAAVRQAIGVNTWEGVEWPGSRPFAAMLAWAERLDAIDRVRPTTRPLTRPTSRRDDSSTPRIAPATACRRCEACSRGSGRQRPPMAGRADDVVMDVPDAGAAAADAPDAVGVEQPTSPSRPAPRTADPS